MLELDDNQSMMIIRGKYVLKMTVFNPLIAITCNSFQFTHDIGKSFTFSKGEKTKKCRVRRQAYSDMAATCRTPDLSRFTEVHNIFCRA